MGGDGFTLHLDFSATRPIYLQIVDEVKRAIARGELRPGDRIPSQRDLAVQVRVNPNTVQRAYREMERLEMTETVRGEGTFVTQNPALVRSLRGEMAQRALERFLQEMRGLGFEEPEIRKRVERALGSHGEGEDGHGGA
ncbi:GntR family transcriptional regulator [Limnochorda pilosa]|uniref:GntR family transcriptional regulator n=1 Tax=Limnochorda pilosa TaxID=1555112 RepID=A0A0K2SG75_LIMPI|nr:GntR family transcriptional regulator [Limnochorda pilosa]BAS26108.1 GntR family transcriptional regulator [Limnochorda pilosa]